MKTWELRTEIRLARPPGEVFEFFGDAGNLQEITPPWLHFRILTPRPIAMRPGARIDYKLRLHGIPVSWKTEITAWEPPRRFVDEQLRGPYRLWVHEHTFEEIEGGTLARDRVRYAVPGPLGIELLANRLLVARDLEAIFRFRFDRLQERFGRWEDDEGKVTIEP